MNRNYGDKVGRERDAWGKIPLYRGWEAGSWEEHSQVKKSIKSQKSKDLYSNVN